MTFVRNTSVMQALSVTTRTNANLLSFLMFQFDLVCGKKRFIAMTRMILMGGLVVGAVSTGVLADW